MTITTDNVNRYLSAQLDSVQREINAIEADGWTLDDSDAVWDEVRALTDDDDWHNDEAKVARWMELGEHPARRLRCCYGEREGLRDSLNSDIVRLGATRYLITSVPAEGEGTGLISPAGLGHLTGFYVKRDVWIETDRLPRHLSANLCVYDVDQLWDKDGACEWTQAQLKDIANA